LRINLKGQPHYVLHCLIKQTETEAVSKTSHFFKKNRQWTESQNRRLCQLTLVMLCSLFLVSLPSKMGLIGCPEMSVRIYHSVLHNIWE